MTKFKTPYHELEAKWFMSNHCDLI